GGYVQVPLLRAQIDVDQHMGAITVRPHAQNPARVVDDLGGMLEAQSLECSAVQFPVREQPMWIARQNHQPVQSVIVRDGRSAIDIFAWFRLDNGWSWIGRSNGLFR